MNPETLKGRTKDFGLQVFRMVEQMPTSRHTDTLGRQLVRAAMAVGANYRAACLARSRSDFIAKIKVVEEEADESAYWLEVIAEAGLVDKKGAALLLKEARELTAIFASSAMTARSNRQLSMVNGQ
jgi:four helix bundle protein